MPQTLLAKAESALSSFWACLLPSQAFLLTSAMSLSVTQARDLFHFAFIFKSYDVRIVKFTLLMYSPECSDKPYTCVATTTIKSENSSITAQNSLVPLHSQLSMSPPHTQTLAGTLLLSVPLVLPFSAYHIHEII